MLATARTLTVDALPAFDMAILGAGSATPVTVPARRAAAAASRRDDITEMLSLLAQTLAPQKQIVRAGDSIYRAGERFDCLHILNSGMAKAVKFTADGREQVVGLKFRGDWLGFDGIARGAYGCDAVALDTGEVWSIHYDQLMASCGRHPALLTALHEAMSREITRDRESLMSVCTLSADARVADFLHYWAVSLGLRGQRTDRITLRLTRAEVGNYLGLTLESVSRAFSKLAREEVIEFLEKGRRDIRIPELARLAAFVERSLSPESVSLQ